MSLLAPRRPDLSTAAVGSGRRPRAGQLPPRQRRVRPATREVRPQREVPPQLERSLTVVSTTAAMTLLVSVWVLGQMLFLGGLSQQRAQADLYDEFRNQLASAVASVGPVTEVGDPVALVRVPRLGIEQVVVEGTASGDMLRGPGHQRHTVLPGQVGTSVLMGRAATYGGPFAGLGTLTKGDTVVTVTAQGTTEFTVLGVRRAGDPLPQPRPDGAARLVLVTAEGDGALAALSPGEVVHVDAEAKEGQPAPAGLPASVPDSEQPMGTESTAFPLLTLCLAVLVALTTGVIAARQRFSTALVWVVATPVVIATALITTDVVMRVLPNLL